MNTKPKYPNCSVCGLPVTEVERDTEKPEYFFSKHFGCQVTNIPAVVKSQYCRNFDSSLALIGTITKRYFDGSVLFQHAIVSDSAQDEAPVTRMDANWLEVK